MALTKIFREYLHFAYTYGFGLSEDPSDYEDEANLRDNWTDELAEPEHKGGSTGPPDDLPF